MVDNPVVVFDIGNVLIRWDPRFLYRKLFADAARMEWFLATICSPEWNLAQDRGRGFAEATESLICAHPEWAAEIRAFDERWQEMIPETIAENVDLLERLKSGGEAVYAITNFSAEKFRETRKRFAFLDLFDGVIVSGEERLVKPDPAIYMAFLDRYGLVAPECIFIDDSSANVEGARRVGMRAIHYRPGLDLAGALRDEGVAVLPAANRVSAA